MSLSRRLRRGLAAIAAGIDPDPDRALESVLEGGRRRRLAGIAGAVVLCVVLGAVGAIAIPRLLRDTGRARAEQIDVELFDPNGPFDTGVDLSSRPGGIAVADGSVWVAMPAEERVLRLDARTGRPETSIPLPGKPCGEPGLLRDLNWVWFASCDDVEEVWAVDADSDRVAQTLAPAGGIAGGSGRRFWVWSNTDHTVNLRDQSEGELEKFRVWNSTGIFDGIVSRNRVWVTDSERGMLSPINQRTGAFPDVRVGHSAADVEAGVGAVWVADDVRGSVVKVGPRTEKVIGRVRVAPAASDIDIVVVGGSVWARTETRLVRIAPRLLEITEKVRVAGGSGALAGGEGALWVAVPAENKLLRLPLD